MAAVDQAGSTGLSWATIRALLRNSRQVPLAKSEHEGQTGGREEVIPAQGSLGGDPAPALLPGQRANQGPGLQQDQEHFLGSERLLTQRCIK